MPVIELKTAIKAPVEGCFDLSRSIDLHKIVQRILMKKLLPALPAGLLAPMNGLPGGLSILVCTNN